MAHGSTRRRTVWKDSIIANGALAGTTVVANPLLAETDIEGLGSGVTVTRIVGDLFLTYAVGVANVISGAIWVTPQFGGVGVPALVIDFFERSRVMWTMQRQIDLADDTTRVPIDIRTQRKLGSGVALDLVLDNKSVNALTFSFHLRALVLLP